MADKKQTKVYLIPEGETRDHHTYHYTAIKTRNFILENKKMRMKKSFPIFGNRNEEIMPNFWQREYEAGIPGNGQEQDVNISLFAIFL